MSIISPNLHKEIGRDVTYYSSTYVDDGNNGTVNLKLTSRSISHAFCRIHTIVLPPFASELLVQQVFFC